MGHEVDPAALRRSAGAAREMADVVHGLNLSALSDAALGMPGSASGRKAGGVEQHMSTDAKVKAKNLNRYAKKVDAAADRYEGDDEQGRQAFGG